MLCISRLKTTNSEGNYDMIRKLILATSMLVLATGSSEALAYSDASSRLAARTPASVQEYQTSPPAFDQSMPWSTIEADRYRYHGGPKSND